MSAIIALSVVTVLAFGMGCYLVICAIAVARVCLAFDSGEYVFPCIGFVTLAALFFWLAYTLAPFSIQVTP